MEAQSALSQQALDTMHCAPHTFWPAAQEHAPAWQLCPAVVHSLSEQQAAIAMQAPLHGFIPDGHAQPPPWQVPPPAHTFAAQAASAQSMAPLQLLSRPSSHFSAAVEHFNDSATCLT